MENSFYDENGDLKEELLENVMKQYLSSPNDSKSYMIFYKAISESHFYVPVNLYLSQQDQNIIQNGLPGMTYQASKDTRVEPDILISKDKKEFLPIFSSIQKIPSDYKNQFHLLTQKFFEIIDLYLAEKEVGIVINPFSESIKMEKFTCLEIREEFRIHL